MPSFTLEELAEMAAADEEIERDFCLTQEERRASMEEDREVRAGRLDNQARRRLAYQAGYRAANREKIAARQAEYRAANREKIAAQQAGYRAANREKIAAYQAEYYAANREKIAARRKAKREKKKGESGK